MLDAGENKLKISCMEEAYYFFPVSSFQYLNFQYGVKERELYFLY